MKKKKYFSILLAVVMIATMFTGLSITANAATDTWKNHTASDFAGGTGTASDPYQINTAAQFAYFAAQVNSGNTYYNTTINKPCYIELTNNIDLSTYDWNPIGGMWSSNSGTASGKCFKGIFNGYDESAQTQHTITGLNVLMGKSGIGLFGYVNGGTLANVIVSGAVSTNGGSYAAVGGLVGYTSGNIVNCVSSVNVTAGGTSASNAGSLAGIVENTTTATNLTTTNAVVVQNCSSSGNVTCNGTRFGGMIGSAYAKATGGIVIDRCTVTGGTVTGSNSAYKTFLGGMLGYCEASISNCIVGPNVTVHPTSGADGHRMGGVTGILSGFGSGKGRMADCVFLGTLINKNTNPAWDGVLCVPESGTVMENSFYYASAGTQSTDYNASNVYGLTENQMKSIDTVDGTNMISYFLNMSTVPAWNPALSGAWTCSQGSEPVMNRVSTALSNEALGKMGRGAASTGNDSAFTTGHTYVYYDSTASSGGTGTAAAPFNSFSDAVDAMVETNNEKEILIVKSPISVNDYNTYGGSLSGKTIGRSYTLSEPIFTVGTNDILSLSSITIDGNTNTANNESLVKIDGGSFTLGSGAVLTHNNTMSRDSAVREESGTFTMSSGAEIKDNSSTLGGIVYVGHGTSFELGSANGIGSNQVVYLENSLGLSNAYISLTVPLTGDVPIVCANPVYGSYGTGTVVAQGANDTIISNPTRVHLKYKGYTLSREYSGSPCYIYISAISS